jgi:integrase
MPVKPRGSSWQATVHHKGERYRKDFSTKADAEVWEAEVKLALAKGLPLTTSGDVKPTTPTLAEFFKTIVRPYWAPQKAAETSIKNGEQVIACLGPEREVSTLSIHDADKVREHFRAKGRSEATVNRKLAALSLIFKFAYQRGYIPVKPIAGLTKERDSGRRRIISSEEEARMLAWCDLMGECDFKDYLVVSIDTGFRRGEVTKMVPSEVEPGMVTTYDTKGGGDRTVPLTPRADEVLRTRCLGKRRDEKLFPYEPRWLLDRWYKMAKAIGINVSTDEDFVPHALRHTFVTRLLRAGVDIETVRQLAGHKNITTTQIYAKSSPEYKALAIQRLSSYTPQPVNATPHATSVA